MTTDTDAPGASHIVEYDEIEANIATLRAEFAGRVFDLTTAAGDKLAREVRGKFVKLRTTLEAIRVREKAPLLARGRSLDAEAARFTKELLALEKPIDEQIKADERRRAAEAAEKARIERERIAALQKRISAIRDEPRACIGKPAQYIADTIGDVEDIKIGEEFAEFVDDAMAARATTLEALRALHGQAVAAEETARQLEAERAERRRIAAEQAAREAKDAEDRRLKAIQDAADASFDTPVEKIVPPASARPARAEPASVAQAPAPQPAALPVERPRAAPIVSAPVSAPAPIARPSASAWGDQVQRPIAAPAAAATTFRHAAEPVRVVAVAVPVELIEDLIRAAEVGDADQSEEWNEILNDFRKLIGAPLVEFVA